MPSKYQIISELASQTARDITSKAERYTDFLVTAANNYKYRATADPCPEAGRDGLCGNRDLEPARSLGEQGHKRHCAPC